jgi:hypothetical protein
LLTWTAVAGNDRLSIEVDDGTTSVSREIILTVKDLDIVSAWNLKIMTYLSAKGISNQFGSRATAMMHTAIFDSVNSIVNVYWPYHGIIPTPCDATVEAAAATAAYTILTTMYPADANLFDSLYEAQMDSLPDSQSKAEGAAVGNICANAIIQLRADDNSASANTPFVDGTLPGQYRRTGPMDPMLPGWGFVTPWGMASGSQFRLQGPPELTSAEYTAAYQETMALGARNSALRSAQQSEDALYWIAGVPDHWHAIAREMSARNNLTLEENARLFALLSVSLADASIAGWDTKYTHAFWRPVTAIRLADTDGNPDTISNPMWMPFITTPAFPEYASGHSTTCSAGATLLADFFGSDSAVFTRPSATPGLPAHEYHSFSEVAEEAGASRIPAGVHFSFSNYEALEAGAKVAHYVYDNLMQPAYVYDGTCRPIKSDGTSQFKSGSVIPVKFELKYPNGDVVTDASATLELAMTTEGGIGEYQRASSVNGPADDNNFRFSETDDKYVFNLATKDLPVGRWQLRIGLDNGDTYYAQFTLRSTTLTWTLTPSQIGPVATST